MEDNFAEKEASELLSEYHQKFNHIRNVVATLAKDAHELQQSWERDKASLKLLAVFAEATEKHNTLLEQFRNANISISYEELQRQCGELEQKLQDIEKLEKQLIDNNLKHGEAYQALYKYRHELCQQRKSFLENVLQDNPYISIDVIPFDYKLQLEKEIRTLLFLGETQFNSSIDALVSRFSGRTSQNNLEKVYSFKRYITAIHEGDEIAVKSLNDSRLVTRIQNLQPVQIDQLWTWFPEDRLEVKYKPDKSSRLKPIDNASPGQKTAALLAFILSYGDEPLILDQPEDDLDNLLIYELIVQQLRQMKQRRQIIIVTHNANIVVNGDAENIITFGIEKGQTIITSQGSLQDKNIRDEICRIMEGGKDAFEQRYKRIYGDKK